MARDLGVHHEALRNWIRQDEADRGERDDRLTTAEKEELAALRKENAELRRSCEILKAASVESTGQRNRASSLSAGVSKSRVCRGRVFNRRAMASRSSWVR
ncbi:transposase [Kitasatospora sp. NPDC001539]|uniref:transposase n=1 Tax=Kitasatospora sp. NPDC001539 TaxID=3154384 RepID=UPI00331A897D